MSHADLSQRKQLILKAVIEAYIADGEPVGSKYLASDKQLSCSSATIRNEMAELESLGFLEQPHTSAGRVPSELGYRYYVDTLLSKYHEATAEIENIHLNLQRKMGELDQILADASRLVSSVTNYPSIAVKPRISLTVIERFECAYIDEKNFVFIMLFTGGTVKTKNIRLAFSVSPMELADLTGLFNQKVSGKTAEQLSVQLVYELEKQMGLASQLVNPMIKVVYETMAEIDGGDVRIDGVNHLLEYPEYANVEKLKDLLGLFEEKENLLDLIPSTSEEDGINVFIGRENGLDVMAESSLIFKTIKQGDKVVGAIGVIGPRRMDYAKVFGIINQLSDNIHHVINAKLPPPKKENL